MGQGGILNLLMPREDNDGAGRAVKPHICDAREAKKKVSKQLVRMKIKRKKSSEVLDKVAN